MGVNTPASGTQGQIRATGDITTSFSDQRLKTILGPIDDALDRVKKLRGVYYRVNNLAREYGLEDSGLQVGLIAQEVQEVLPEVVRPAPFDCGPGGSSLSGQHYLTIMYSRVVPLLIEALKQQKQQLDRIGQIIQQRGLK